MGEGAVVERGAREPVAITGMGAVSALGEGVGAILDALRDGRDGLTEMERFDVRPLAPVRLAGWLRARWERGEAADLEAWSIAAAREAWADAGLAGVVGAPGGIAWERVAVIAGTTVGEEGAITRVAEAVAEAIGARGPRWTISTACASSTNAIGLGRDLIAAGDADVVIAGGAERLVAEIFAGFAALGVLGAEKCAPFGESVGTTLGEGAGFVVLERAGAREGARAHARLLGYALSSDAWHETSPDPRGEGIARAVAWCVQDAGIEERDVDYVNAHATGTAANDDSEWRGIQRALGARAGEIPVSASKGYLGHAQGAAGVLETIATIACMREGLVPPSARVGRGRPRGPSDAVGETGRARVGEIGIALVNSAAFGGANAVIAVGGTGTGSDTGSGTMTRRVIARGVGVIATGAGAARDEAGIARACGDVDLRGSDPSSRYAIAASARALADAGLKVRAAVRDRVGMFGGTSGPPRASVEEFRVSLERGLDRASAPAFARTVCHAPIGAASRALGARGPATSVAGEGVAGLLAIAYAARWLRDRDDAEWIVAGGVDERAADAAGEEGAAMVVLRAEDAEAQVAEGAAVIAGVATSGSAEDAIARALAEASVGAAEVEVWRQAPPGASAASLASAAACVGALAAIREGARVAVASASGAQGAVAIVLLRGARGTG